MCPTRRLAWPSRFLKCRQCPFVPFALITYTNIVVFSFFTPPYHHNHHIPVIFKGMAFFSIRYCSNALSTLKSLPELVVSAVSPRIRSPSANIFCHVQLGRSPLNLAAPALFCSDTYFQKFVIDIMKKMQKHGA